jgi:hypothetical protein
MDNFDIAFNILQYLKIKKILNASTVNKACDMQYRKLLANDYGSIFEIFFS